MEPGSFLSCNGWKTPHPHPIPTINALGRARYSTLICGIWHASPLCRDTPWVARSLFNNGRGWQSSFIFPPDRRKVGSSGCAPPSATRDRCLCSSSNLFSGPAPVRNVETRLAFPCLALPLLLNVPSKTASFFSNNAKYLAL